MAPRLQLSRKLLFLLLILAFIAGGFAGAFAYRRLRIAPATRVELRCTTSIEPGGLGALQRPDPELGWRYVDGDFRVKIACEELEIPHEFTLTMSEGCRISRPKGAPGAPDEVWLLGCSFFFGWGVDDDETVSWRLQERFPAWTFRNFAIPAHGTSQFLVRFERELKNRPRPRAMVFSHAAFHAPRNIMARAHTQGRPSSFPAAVVENGRLKEMRFVDHPISTDEEGVTLAVTRRLLEICQDRKILAILACINGPLEAPVCREWKARGGVVIDLTAVDYTVDAFNLQPYDGHPNARGHQRYAEGIARALKQHLSAEGSSASSR